MVTPKPGRRASPAAAAPGRPPRCFRLPVHWGSANSASTSQLPSFGAQTGASKPIGALSRQTGSPPQALQGGERNGPAALAFCPQAVHAWGSETSALRPWPGLVRTDGAQKVPQTRRGSVAVEHRRQPQHSPDPRSPLEFSGMPRLQFWV